MAEVVVTGVSSFVGHHLARHWALLGHHVIGTISRPRDRYLGIAAERIAAIEPYVEIFGLDLREAREIAALVDRRAPSLWIQHAGFATAYGSFDYDLDVAHQVNVASLMPLYAALRGGPCGVIITGSSFEYTTSETGNREDDACAPDTPYGLSKLAQTLRARQLAEQLDVPSRVARLYIPFGARDNPEKLLSQTVAKLRNGEPIALSPCEQKRDFLGITDVCEAYVRLADDLARPGFDIFNIAGGDPVRLRGCQTRPAPLRRHAHAAGRTAGVVCRHRQGAPRAGMDSNAAEHGDRPRLAGSRQRQMTSLARVSVIMSVLNGEAFLRPAVESILGQTFRDFEFIVIDNASSDGTAGILDGYRDDRIVRLRNDDIRTLTQSLNRGLHAARGEYVARLDADDLAAAERLGRQVAFLDANPDVVLVASHLRIIDETDRVIGHFRSPSEEAALYDDLAYRNPIGHSAAMFRRAPVLALGGYPPAYVFAQDLALWVMLAQRHARFGMIGDLLGDNREHSQRTTLSPAMALLRHRESIEIFETALRLPRLSDEARRRGRINLARLHCLLAGALMQSGDGTGAALELAHGIRLAPLFCVRRAIAGRWRTALPDGRAAHS